MIDAGVPLRVIELPERKELTGPTPGQIVGHPYAAAGQERADAFENALLGAGVEIIYSCEAKELVFDGEGKAAGVRCEIDGKVVDIMAGAICLCTGGFLGNEEMVAKYFAGSRIVPMGNPNCKGAGINIANAIAMGDLAARAIWDLSHRPQPDSMGGLGITRARPHL